MKKQSLKKQHQFILLTNAILATVFGGLVIAQQFLGWNLSMLDVVWWFGVYLLAAGVLTLVLSFFDEMDSSSTFLEGNIEAIIGFIIVFYPFVNLQVGLALMIVWLLTKGIFRSLHGFLIIKSWAGMAILLNGILALAAGIVVLSFPIWTVETLMVFGPLYGLTMLGNSLLISKK